ncbi:DUF4178 domain-containing protein [Corynebacterium uberis]
MNYWWIILALVAGAAAVYFLMRGAQASRKEQEQRRGVRQDPLAQATPDRKFGPDMLGPGAIVTYGATDYVVRGSVEVRQGYYVWHEHMLDGGSGSEWLSVDVSEGQLDLSWWTTRTDLQLTPAPQVTVDGVTYRKKESGVADFTTEGTTGLPESGSLEYWDYQGPDGKLLGLERFGSGPWEVSVGRELRSGEVIVYPAPEQ